MVQIEFSAHRRPATAYLAGPAGGAGPGVLVLHAWWGLNGFIRDLCDRLAAEGFVAVAPDLYRGATAATATEAAALRRSYRNASYTIGAAAQQLRERTINPAAPIGIVGLSMGGHWALWFAQQPGHGCAAVVLFYGVRGGSFGNSDAAFLAHLAEEDPFVSAGAALRFERSVATTGQPVTVHRYPGTGHWFFEADRPDAYAPEAAALAWSRTVDFLRAHLGEGNDHRKGRSHDQSRF